MPALKGKRDAGDTLEIDRRETQKKVRFDLPGVGKQALAPKHEISGGNTDMEESGNSKALGSRTHEAFLRESIGAIYEKSRAYWDPTMKQGDDNDQKKKGPDREHIGAIYEKSRTSWDLTVKDADATDLEKKSLDTLKTLAYIKLGEEIMKQDVLVQHLGFSTTDTQLTKIRDGALYAFEKDDQLHITCNKSDAGVSKLISLNDAVARIDRSGIEKITWHLPKVYAIKLEGSSKEDIKVLIIDNDELFNNCKQFIESGSKEAASKVLIVDTNGRNKEFFDNNLKMLIEQGEVRSLQWISGQESGVDLPDMPDSHPIKNKPLVKLPGSFNSNWVEIAPAKNKQVNERQKDEKGIKLPNSKQIQAAKDIETKNVSSSHQDDKKQYNAPEYKREISAKSEWNSKNKEARNKDLDYIDKNFTQVNVPGTDLNCLLYAVLRAYGYDLDKQRDQVDTMIRPVREDINSNSGEQSGSMLDLANGSGMAAIGMLRDQQKQLDSDRGIVVRVQDANGHKWVWEVIPSANGKDPIYLHLQNQHFQALIPKNATDK